MAAAAVSFPPQQPSYMSSRRPVLTNNPNAINSPYRASTALKRPRGTTNDGKELENQDSPPKKRQLIDVVSGSRRSHHVIADDREGRVFVDKGESTSSNAFNKKLAAIRDSKASQQQRLIQKEEKISVTDQENQETIKQWRKHYRKAFPTFVFYFESISGDVRARSIRHLTYLGAREEKFFSKAVTHIVTTRPIPSGPTDNEVSENTSSSHRAGGSIQSQSSQRTINPSLLDKSAALQLIQSRSGKQALEAASQRRRDALLLQETETRRQQSSNGDVLLKGRELGMKIWPLEKFQRMMDTLIDNDAEESSIAQAQRRLPTTTTVDVKPEPAKLSELLRNEKSLGHDRLPWSDIIPFQGVYIYIHDVNERTKPVMVREYAKVVNKEDGEWPQFRSNPAPRCPFVDEQANPKREAKEKEETEKEEPTNRKAATDEVRQREIHPNTRSAASAIEAARLRGNVERGTRTAMQEANNTANRMAKPPLPPTLKTFDPPPPIKVCTSNNLDSMPPQLGSARLHFAGLVRPGREPMASGVQQSNLTSAIRSQMISSTAAAPTGKAGTSKEMHQLQRRAVERHSSFNKPNIGSSLMNNVRAAINDERHTEVQRRTSHTTSRSLGRIHEDATISEDELNQPEVIPTQTKPRKKQEAEKPEPKPGYCENCRDKYEDFTEHIESRKHKKFALTQDNWADLDLFLRKLARR